MVRKRFRSLFLASLALVTLLLPTAAFGQSVPGDLVTNGTFSEGLAPWFWQLNGGGAGGKADASVNDGVFHVGNITDVGKQVYSLQAILSPITIAKGVRYHLKFDARAAADRTLNVKIGGVEGRSWADYTGNGGSGIGFKLTTELQTFEADFDMKEPTDKAARLEFSFGLQAPDVWIDNISLAPVGGDLVRDGTLQNGDLSKGTKYWDVQALKAAWSGTGELVLGAQDGELVAHVLQVGSIESNPQIVQTGLVFEQGRQYQVSFYARSSAEREIQVSLGTDLASPPFSLAYSTPRVFQLGAANQPYTFTFTMKEEAPEDGKGKIAFALGTLNGKAVPATVTLSRIEVRELNTKTVVFTPVHADELVRNGHFDLDAEGWQVSGKAKVKNQELVLEAGAQALRQGGLDLTSGQTYRLSLVHRGPAQVSLKDASGTVLITRNLLAAPGGTRVQAQVVFTAPADAEAALEILPSPEATVDRISLVPCGPWLDPSLPVAERVRLLMEQMTVGEKAGQMVQAERAAVKNGDLGAWGIGSILSGGGSVPAENTPQGWIDLYNRFQAEALSSRLAIPMLYGIDAVHGHGNVYGATIFPHNIGLGATRNPELVGEIARITAREVAATGLDWTFGPAVSVARDDRWGRIYESFGEDPELQNLLTPSFIRGLQGEKGSVDWMAGPRVIGTAKHFLGDGGAEYGTGEGNYKIDRGDIRTLTLEQLKAIHGQGYVEAVKQGVGTVMASFNLFQGRHMHAHKELLTGWLKAPVSAGGLGFEGFVIGDWDAMSLLSEVGGDYAHKVLTSFDAGLDMSMEQSKWKEVIGILETGINEGTFDQARMDDAVWRILTVKFASGLFDQPWALDTYASELGSVAHRAVAARAVQESAVLLKNGNGKDGKKVLPLKAGAKVFVNGPLADNIGWQSGGWTIQWQGASDQGATRLTPGTSLLEGMKAMAAATGGQIITDPARAKECSVAVVFVGETPYAEGVGDVSLYSDMDLDTATKAASGNLEALAQAKAAGLPIVTVLVSGRPLVVTKELPGWAAFVAAWLPGSEGGALAEVLYGKLDFQGKLPVTWPASVDQEPVNVGDKDLKSKKVLFPYGFGLTYGR